MASFFFSLLYHSFDSPKIYCIIINGKNIYWVFYFLTVSAFMTQPAIQCNSVFWDSLHEKKIDLWKLLSCVNVCMCVRLCLCVCRVCVAKFFILSHSRCSFTSRMVTTVNIPGCTPCLLKPRVILLQSTLCTSTVHAFHVMNLSSTVNAFTGVSFAAI